MGMLSHGAVATLMQPMCRDPGSHPCALPSPPRHSGVPMPASSHGGPGVMLWRCCESVGALSQGRVAPLVPGLEVTSGVGSAAWWVGGPGTVPPLRLCAVLAALLRTPGWHGRHERALVLLQPQQHHGSLPFAANKFPVLGTWMGRGEPPSSPASRGRTRDSCWPSIPVAWHRAPSPGVGGCWLGSQAAGKWVLCLLTPEPMASHSVGLALPPGGPKEPPWHWRHRGWPPSCLGITPLGVASLWVLCFLWYCTSLGVAPPGMAPPWISYCVSMGIVPLGIAPPWVSGVWLSCLLGCCVSGYYASGCHASLDVMSLGIVPLRICCLLGYHALGYHATGYCASLSIVHPCASCLWVLWLLRCFASGYHASWVSVLLGCHASSDHASWILCLWVSGLLRCRAFGYCTSECCASLDVMPPDTVLPGTAPLGTALLDTAPPCTVPLGTVPLGIMPLGTVPLGNMPVMVPGRAQGHAWPALVCVKPSCLSFPLWRVVGAGAVTPCSCLLPLPPRLAMLCPLPVRCWCGVPSSGGTVPGPLPWPVL